MNVLHRIKGRIRRELDSRVRRSAWYNELFPDCAKFWKYGMFAPRAAFDLQVMNLGSTSGVCAFDYSGLPVRAENWALRQNPLAADAAILENYSSFLSAKGATVIIPLCPFSALSGSYAFQEDRYYTILSPRSLPAFSRKRQAKILSVRDNPLVHYPLIEAVRAMKSRLLCFVRRRRVAGSGLSCADFEADADQWLRNWFFEFGITDFSTPLSLVNQDGIEDAAMHLKKMLVFCRERGHRPVLVIPPMHRSLAQKFTPEARGLLIDSLTSRLGAESVVFLNYMDDPEFTADKSLFQNSFLLNSIGAKKFTRRFLVDLGLIK